jgi:predicted glycoside hydrolase/deacetylase ChbG (UPF0249 family)
MVKSTLENLGFKQDVKLLMIHADDAGLSHSENRATIRALKEGLVNSYSIMVPCPWFYEITEFALQYPDFDYGIHLTLTCEWNSYKFGPVLSKKEVPSLVDNQGFFFKTRQEVLDKAILAELKKELCAQIDRALSFGLQPSHLDSHMYTLGASQEFLAVYREIGRLYKLPVMLNSELISQVSGIPEMDLALENEVLIDRIYLGNFKDYKEGKLPEYYTDSIKALKPGLNMLLIHTAFDDPEMQAITKDHPNFGAVWRQVDLEFFTSLTCKNLLKDQGIKMISWKEIKSILYP